MSSESRVWFITGTSSGIGRCLVESVLENNERVVATLRKPEALVSLSTKYPENQLLVKKLDVTDFAEVEAVMNSAVEHFGHIDVIVNNAGYGLLGEIEALPESEARKQFEVQYWGPVEIMKRAAKIFREVNKPQGGLVLNVTSIGGYSATPALSYYASSKFALEGFTESFLKEMPPAWNVKACIIEPGGVVSEWNQGSMIVSPQHIAYADPDTPTSRQRRHLANASFLGLADRTANAILAISREPNPPLRLQLGSGALAIALRSARTTIENAEKWAHLSHSTNKDNVDGEAYTKKLLEDHK